MGKNRTRTWTEIADKYNVSVGLLKASLNLDKLNLRSENQRKLFPKKIQEIYRQLGNPDDPENTL